MAICHYDHHRRRHHHRCRPSLPVLAACLAASCLRLAVPCAAQDFYSGTDVVELTAASFRSRVLDDEHVWMVEFYAPWCGHCQRLKPDYIKAATATKGIVRFGAINCDEHKSIASEYGIRGFPTLKLFGKNKKRPDDYNGARSPKAMADATIALLPNHVTVVTGKTVEEFLGAQAEGSGGATALPKALLFTSKATTTALYKALALDLKGRMALGEVRAKKEAVLAAKYGVEESDLPVLLVLPSTSEGNEGSGSTVRYEGQLKHKPLLQFLEKHALPKSDKKGSKSKPTKDSKPEKASSSSSGSESSKASKKDTGGKDTVGKGAAGTLVQLKSPADAEAHCLRVKGSLCVIALLPEAEESELQKQVALLQGLADKYHNDPLRFSWVHLGRSPSVAAALAHDDTGHPHVVVMAPKRGKFAAHAGLEGLEGMLDRALGGDLRLDQHAEDGWHSALASAWE